MLNVYPSSIFYKSSLPVSEQIKNMPSRTRVFIATLQFMGFTPKGKSGFAFILVRYSGDSYRQEVININNDTKLVTYYKRSIELGTDMKYKLALECINFNQKNKNPIDIGMF